MFEKNGFQKYAQVYSRVPCKSKSSKVPSNSKDEAAVIFFDRNLNLIEKKKFMTGKNVNIIKSAKYGKNIFVIFSTTTKSDGQFVPAKYDMNNDKAHMLLLKDGFKELERPKIIDLDEYIINNDNPINLKNGNVAWSFVGKDNILKVFTLKTPKRKYSSSFEKLTKKIMKSYKHKNHYHRF